MGNFDGSGGDDVIAFVRNSRTGVGQGDAWVALSTGTGFAVARKWSDWICIGHEVCAVGDFDATAAMTSSPLSEILRTRRPRAVMCGLRCLNRDRVARETAEFRRG